MELPRAPKQDRLILQEYRLSLLCLEMAFLFLNSICHMIGLPIESLCFWRMRFSVTLLAFEIDDSPVLNMLHLENLGLRSLWERLRRPSEISHHQSGQHAENGMSLLSLGGSKETGCSLIKIRTRSDLCWMWCFRISCIQEYC